MTDPLLANLNPEQLAAVTLPHQSALILAGAGSGKTRVLTTRIAWLLGTGQASPLSILAVTFTNKAAKEMLVRLSSMTLVHTRGMWIGTFHGLCNRMLRAHFRDANLPQVFQILDSQDQLGLIKRFYRAHDIDERGAPRERADQLSSVETVDQALKVGHRPSFVGARRILAGIRGRRRSMAKIFRVSALPYLGESLRGTGTRAARASPTTRRRCRAARGCHRAASCAPRRSR